MATDTATERPAKKKKPIAIYYEHPHWFRPLFAELERRQTPHVKIDATSHQYDTAHGNGDYSLLFNRMSPSAYKRGHGQGIFYTLNYLDHLEQRGTRVVNGQHAFRVEISKAKQLDLLESLALPYPKARVINHPDQAVEAAVGLCYPIVVKPNTGGSGVGVKRFDTPEALERAVKENQLDFGLDNIALVQEFIPARGGFITRVEVLGGKFLYAIKVHFTGESYDLCPADACKSTDGKELSRSACAVDAPKNGLRVEGYRPPQKIIASVEKIMQTAKIEVGGVEYIEDDRDGQIYYYDINALSNFVADAKKVIGFDPFVNLVDYLEKEAG